MTCDKHWTEGARITDFCYSCDVRAEMSTRDLSVAEALKHEETADPEAGVGVLMMRAARHVTGHLDGWIQAEHGEDEGGPLLLVYRDDRLVASFGCADDADEYLFSDRNKAARRRINESR